MTAIYFACYSDFFCAASTALTRIVQCMGTIELFPIAKGSVSVSLLDGHGSRTELEFLSMLMDHGISGGHTL